MEMIIKIDQMFYLLRELPSTAIFWKRGRGAVFYSGRDVQNNLQK